MYRIQIETKYGIKEQEIKNYKKHLKCRKKEEKKIDNDWGNILYVHSFVHSTWNNWSNDFQKDINQIEYFHIIINEFKKKKKK